MRRCSSAWPAGFAPDVVAALASGEPCEQLEDDERAAQRFTLELARDRVIADSTYAIAEKAFGRDGLVALAFLAAAYTGTLLLNAFAVPAPFD